MTTKGLKIQKIQREEIIKYIVVIAAVTLPVVIIDILIIIRGENVKELLILLALILPVYIPTVLLGANQLEWYCLYDDRIEAKGILGIKNTVYYNDVIYVEEVEIPLTSRGTYRTFFLFQDGRKNNGNVFNSNSCYNRKKYTFRIYKTPDLEAYIVDTLHFPIKKDRKF